MNKQNIKVDLIKEFFTKEFGISLDYCFCEGTLPPDIARKLNEYIPKHNEIKLFSVFPHDGEPYLAVYGADGYLFYLRHREDGVYTAYIENNYDLSSRIGLKFALLLEFAERSVFGMHALTMLAAAPNGRERVILLAAPSGTGKTTHGELWRSQFGTRILNGDYAFLEVKKSFNSTIPNGETLFRGTPYCGSSKYAEPGTWRVDDIVFLRQAPYNRAERMGGREAYKNMVKNSFVPFWDTSKFGSVLDMLTETLQNVRVWQLDCTPDPEAARVLYDAIFACGQDGCEKSAPGEIREYGGQT